MENQTDLLQEEVDSKYKRRRQLLPWWIKVFVWIFLVFGAILPVGIVAAVLGYNFQIALYGLETNEPLSLIGILLIILFLLKSIVAFGLWTEKKWAVNLGIIDAISGIVICIFIMLIYPFIDNTPGFSVNVRLELILIIPYLIKLNKINTDWQSLTLLIR